MLHIQVKGIAYFTFSKPQRKNFQLFIKNSTIFFNKEWQRKTFPRKIHYSTLVFVVDNFEWEFFIFRST